MNTILAALAAGGEQPDLESYGLSSSFSCLVLTPRFRASRHVVLLLFPRGSSDPALVAKIPRLAGDSSGIERESSVLTAAQNARSGGYATIPRLVAYEEVGARAILVESALVGLPLTPERVRRDPSGATDSVLSWLGELPSAEKSADGDRFVRLIEDPLSRFALALGREEAELVRRTLDLLEPLRGAPLPSVLEHGDLSHPNLLSLRSGEIGVVDWELGEVKGLPTHDLFLFLTFVAAARAQASTPHQRSRALHDAMIRPKGWAREIATSYAERMGIERRFLAPLLVACFSRYTVGLFERLLGSSNVHAGQAGDVSVPGNSAVRDELVRTLRADRHYGLWRHTVVYADELTWTER